MHRLERRLRLIESPQKARRELPFSHVHPDELSLGKAILEEAMRTGDYVMCLSRFEQETPTVYAEISRISADEYYRKRRK